MNSASRGLWPVVGLRRPGKAPFASAEADAWRGASWEADFNRRQRPSAGGSACTPNEFGLQGPLADGRTTPTWKSTFCVGGGRRLARSALRGRFQSAPRPSADGRPARRMNSASRGLWPTVGLRRPGEDPFASAEADAWRGAPLEADFNRRQGLRPVGRPARRMNSASRGLRPTVGLRRPGEDPFASAEADAWRGAPLEADFNRRQRPLAGGRPAPIGRRSFCVGGGRRLARQRLERPISIGVKGLWPTVGLRRSGKRSLRRRRPTPGAQRL
jgi:hypothetical protein